MSKQFPIKILASKIPILGNVLTLLIRLMEMSSKKQKWLVKTISILCKYSFLNTTISYITTDIISICTLYFCTENNTQTF